MTPTPNYVIIILWHYHFCHRVPFVKIFKQGSSICTLRKGREQKEHVIMQVHFIGYYNMDIPSNVASIGNMIKETLLNINFSNKHVAPFI